MLISSFVSYRLWCNQQPAWLLQRTFCWTAS